MSLTYKIFVFGALCLLATANASAKAHPQTVAQFYGPTPIGVAVSRTGRVFMSFPRAFDQGPFDVAEIIHGKPFPYPNTRVNRLSSAPQSHRLISVQGLSVDAQDRLWLLDLGKIKNNPVSYGGPKLVCVDLKRNEIVKWILFSTAVAGPNAYLNDVRIDLAIGKAGTAFITDSSEKGPNGIVVVDLASGTSRRRLDDHPSVKAEPGFTPIVEGLPLLKRPSSGPPVHDTTGADGLTLSADGQQLFYCPNEGHHLYSVSVAALADPTLTDEQVAATVRNLGDKGFASDGIEAAADGTVYLTDYEHNAVKRRLTNGRYQTVLQGQSLVWPDSISFSRDGFMYLTVDQLDRAAKYHRGKDLRKRPFLLLRQYVRAQPIYLK